MKTPLLLGIFLLNLISLHAQDSLIRNLATANKEIIYFKNQQFRGEALDTLLLKISESKYTLLGEDHHINEVLYFTNYLTQKVNFDTYITEGNQQLTNLMIKHFKKSDLDYARFLKKYSNHFGFYTFKEDRNLLESFIAKNKVVLELDQVFFNSDLPLYEELMTLTNHQNAHGIYKELHQLSQKRWIQYSNNPITEPPFNTDAIPLMYASTPSDKLKSLLKTSISANEKAIINDIIISNTIYRLAITGEGLRSHNTRISLMKKNLLDNYDQIKGKRNLFKFGANHVTKHKSLWQNTPDVGNLVLNLADSENQKSLHIAIIQKSGFTGDFFQERKETSGLSFLKPFYDLVGHADEWLLFNLNKINAELIDQKIPITSTPLKNFIEGYDYLILIPEVSAQVK